MEARTLRHDIINARCEGVNGDNDNERIDLQVSSINKGFSKGANGNRIAIHTRLETVNCCDYSVYVV